MKKTQLILMFLLCGSLAALAQKTTVEGKPSLQDKYPKKSGNLLFTDMSISYNRLFDNQKETRTIRFYNASSQEIKLSATNVPEYLVVEVTPSVKPKAEGTLNITYDASKRKDYGFIIDQVSLQTTDPESPGKNFTLATIIEPYIPPMTADDSLNGPVLVLLDTVFDYKTVKQGVIAKQDIRITNSGKRDLHIFAVKTTCGCIGATLDKHILAPGESTAIQGTFNSTGKSGRDTHEMIIYSNDPRRSRIQIDVTGMTAPE